MPAFAISSEGYPVGIPVGYSVKVSAGSRLEEATKGPWGVRPRGWLPLIDRSTSQ